MVCLLFRSSGLRMGGRALSREVICHLPPRAAILRGAGAGRCYGSVLLRVSRGSAPRSVSSPGLLGKPCLKTRKETRSDGAHPCFVPFKRECSKDSGERRLAVCWLSAASVRACALRAATSENLPHSGPRRKQFRSLDSKKTCRRTGKSYAARPRRTARARRVATDA